MTMKRIFALCIILALALAIIPAIPILAAENSHVQLVADLGIVPENDETGLLPKVFTRADFAHSLCAMTKKTDGLGIGEDTAASYAADIKDHKYCGEIASVLALDYMTNKGNNNFNPADALTLEEAVTALVKMLGYDPMARADGGDYNAYYRIALKTNLLKGVTVANANRLSILEASEIIANAMKASFFTPDNITQTDECLWDRWGIKEKSGRILANSNMGMMVGKTNYKEVNIDGTIYYTNLLIENEWVGSQVTYYTIQGDFGEEVVSIYIDEYAKTVTVKSGDIEYVSDDGTHLKVVYNENNQIKLDKTGYAIINGHTQSPTIQIFNLLKSGSVTFVDTDSDAVYDVAHITLLFQTVIGGVNPNTLTLATRYDNQAISFDGVDNYEVYVGKNAATFSDLKSGMTVGIATDRFTIVNNEIVCDFANSEYIRLYASNQSEKGYITSLIGSEEFEISEMTRSIGSGYNRLVSNGYLPEIRLGEYVIAYYDNYGALTYFETTSEGGGMKYGYLVAAGISGGLSVKNTEIKVLDTAGDFHIYPVSKKFTLDGGRVDGGSVVYTVNAPGDVDLTVRQLIRYREVDGIVKEIDTKILRSGVETAANSLDESLPVNPTSQYTIRSGAIDRLYAFASDCMIFLDSTYSDETYPSERSFTVQKESVFGNNASYYMAGYDTNENNEISCVIIYENYGESSSSAQGITTGPLSVTNYSCYVVEKVVNTTKNDESGWTITIAGEDKKETLFVSQEVVKLYELAGMLYSDYYASGDIFNVYERPVASFDTLISKGDIIRIKKNAYGEVSVIEKMFDFSTYKDGFIQVENYNTTNSFVKLEKISGNNIIFSNGDTTRYVSRKTSRYSNAVLYHVGTGEVEILPLSEIPSEATGNNVKCYIRFYNYGNVYDNLFYIFD